MNQRRVGLWSWVQGQIQISDMVSSRVGHRDKASETTLPPLPPPTSSAPKPFFSQIEELLSSPATEGQETSSEDCSHNSPQTAH